MPYTAFRVWYYHIHDIDKKPHRFFALPDLSGLETKSALNLMNCRSPIIFRLLVTSVICCNMSAKVLVLISQPQSFILYPSNIMSFHNLASCWPPILEMLKVAPCSWLRSFNYHPLCYDFDPKLENVWFHCHHSLTPAPACNITATMKTKIKTDLLILCRNFPNDCSWEFKSLCEMRNVQVYNVGYLRQPEVSIFLLSPHHSPPCIIKNYQPSALRCATGPLKL